MKAVVFLCVENSCRSQMAEGFARVIAGKEREIWSAGSRPSGRVNETAIAVMTERGIDLTAQRSKSLSELPSIRWDYVVTMGCGEQCPALPAAARVEWAIPDPKGLPLEEFRRIRDMIEESVKRLLEEKKENTWKPR